jgi:predicted MPP superfamily phosphohydrolase
MSFSWSPFGWINLGLDLAVVLAGVAASALALRRVPGERYLGRDAAVIVAAVCAVGVAWVPVVAYLGGILGASLWARVAWTTATVTGPLCSLWGARRYGKAWPVFVAALLLGAKFYGEVWEPRRLEVQRVEVRLAGLITPVRLVHLSDLQNDSFGSLQERIQKEANAFDPDLVVFTGDAVNHPSLRPAFARYLSGFTHRQGKFFVSGDVDGDLSAELAQGGFTLLDRKAVAVDAGPVKLALFGVPVADAWNVPLIESLAYQISSPRLLLSHRPDAVFAALGLADLVVSGHTHGGQVCLPFYGPVVTLTSVPRKMAAGGLHLYKGVPLLISRGLGWEGHVAPRVRTFCRPHLLLVTLLPKEA